MWTGVVFVSLIYVVLLMMSILDCQPIHRHWDPTVHGQCLPSGVLAYSSGAFNVATDLFVLVVPMPTVWSMNLSTAKKLRVSAVFGLGIMWVIILIHQRSLSSGRSGRAVQLMTISVWFLWALLVLLRLHLFSSPPILHGICPILLFTRKFLWQLPRTKQWCIYGTNSA